MRVFLAIMQSMQGHDAQVLLQVSGANDRRTVSSELGFSVVPASNEIFSNQEQVKVGQVGLR